MTIKIALRISDSRRDLIPGYQHGCGKAAFGKDSFPAIHRSCLDPPG